MDPTSAREHRRVSGYRGRPPRSCLARAEHGNPVGSEHDAVVVWCADRKEGGSPSGDRMTQEANAGASKDDRKPGTQVGSSADVLG